MNLAYLETAIPIQSTGKTGNPRALLFWLCIVDSTKANRNWATAADYTLKLNISPLSFLSIYYAANIVQMLTIPTITIMMQDQICKFIPIFIPGETLTAIHQVTIKISAFTAIQHLPNVVQTHVLESRFMSHCVIYKSSWVGCSFTHLRCAMFCHILAIVFIPNKKNLTWCKWGETHLSQLEFVYNEIGLNTWFHYVRLN